MEESPYFRPPGGILFVANRSVLEPHLRRKKGVFCVSGGPGESDDLRVGLANDLSAALSAKYSESDCVLHWVVIVRGTRRGLMQDGVNPVRHTVTMVEVGSNAYPRRDRCEEGEEMWRMRVTDICDYENTMIELLIMLNCGGLRWKELLDYSLTAEPTRGLTCGACVPIARKWGYRSVHNCLHSLIQLRPPYTERNLTRLWTVARLMFGDWNVLSAALAALKPRNPNQ
jgi:hypothetical protein